MPLTRASCGGRPLGPEGMRLIGIRVGLHVLMRVIPNFKQPANAQVSAAMLTVSSESPLPDCAPPLSRPPACLRWILATCGVRTRAPADAGLLRKVEGSSAQKRNIFGLWLSSPAEPACTLQHAQPAPGHVKWVPSLTPRCVLSIY